MCGSSEIRADLSFSKASPMSFKGSCIVPLPTAFANIFVKWLGHTSIIQNEAVEVTGHTPECSVIANGFRGMSCINIPWIWLKAFLVHKIAKIDKLLLSKHAFQKFRVMPDLPSIERTVSRSRT